MSAATVPPQRFPAGASRAYLARVAPFALLAVVEVSALATLAIFIAHGSAKLIVGAVAGCVAAAVAVAIVRPAMAGHTIDGDSVRIRCGARLDWVFPRSAVTDLRVLEPAALSPFDRAGLGPRLVNERLIAVLGNGPLVELTFADPVPVAFRGSRGWVSVAVVEVEDPPAFVGALGSTAGPRSRSAPGDAPAPPAAPARPFFPPPALGQSRAPVVLAARGLTKRFGGLNVLEEMQFEVEAGEVVVLAGSNGSGKSTTLRILAGVLSASSGEVRVGGHRVGSVAAKTMTAYIPDQPVFYERLTGREHLTFVAQCHGVHDPAVRVDDVLGVFRLQAAADVPTARYSLGMAKKLTVAAALLREPALLLADEPTIGVDLQTGGRFIELVKERRRTGLATVIATHDLDVTEAADRIVVVESGRVQFNGSPDELRRAFGGADLADALRRFTP